ncbi:hypothetical protein [Clostridium sp. ATCC 25772]|uniref:hypothetical protein n=1 Tax=Clostridium sp. ATCC 25772 TaxID=1676991 RepID=UPI000780DEC7|nr:hypothetical protein [Clostridium sp. ATCC 25772]
MGIGWKFPENNFGSLTGISEAGIETFRANIYNSLAREICQNSLDARLKDDEPVIVDFQKIYIGKDSIPGYNDFLDVWTRCLDFWIARNNKKAVDFLKNGSKVLDKEKLCVLRISDFNTTGLTGSDKEYDITPWQNLVKSSGVSDKGDSDGGSFGIGKSAPYACSNLRTLIYSTFDKDGLCATQGVSKLVSFKNNEGNITQGTGYFGQTSRNSAINYELGIDSTYSRGNNTGTDIYVMGFIDEEEWKTEIVKSILEGFLVAIYNNKIVIKVGNIEISQKTLPLVLNDYKNHIKWTYNYYHALTEGETFITDFSGLGEIELKVLISPELHRRALLCRSSGMKIFDKANISSTIPFAAILTLKGIEVNKFFREMETPQHNAWEPGFHSDKKRAKKIRTELFRYIKEVVIQMGRNEETDEIDADGVGEYLPDELFMVQDQNQNDKEETITDKTKNIEIKVIEKVKIPKGISKINGDSLDEEIDAYGNIAIDSDDIDGTARTHKGRKNNSSGGNGTPTGATGKIDGTNGIKKWVEIGLVQTRLFNTGTKPNEYKLVLTPEKNAQKGYVMVKLSGEQSNFNASIKSAKLESNRNQKLHCNDGKIFLNSFIEKQKLSIIFELEYVESCSMEVALYGYSL